MDVGFNGINSLGYSAKDVQILAKYGLGATLIDTQDGPLSGANLPFFALMAGQQAFPWFKENRKLNMEKNWFQNWGQALKNLNAQENGTESMVAIRNAAKIEDAKEGYKAIYSAGAYGEGLNRFRIGKIKESLPDLSKLDKLPTEIQEESKALHAAVKAAVDGGRLEEAETAIAKFNNLVHGQYQTFFGKTGNFLGKCTGVSQIRGWMNKLAASGESPLLQKVLPCVKGAGLWAAIGGVTELFNIVPAFTEGGIGSGIKQIGKSAVKVAGNVAGWFAGEAAGSAAGAVIGTAICPGLGTAAGAIIGGLFGVAGGFLGSWAADKVTKAVVGKDESELIKERKAQKLTQQAMVDPTTLKAILGKVNDRLQSEGDSLDTRVAFKSLQNIGISVDPSQESKIVTGTAQPQQAAPSFSGNPYSMAYQYSNVNPIAELMLQRSINTSNDPMDMDISNNFMNNSLLRPGFAAQA